MAFKYISFIQILFLQPNILYQNCVDNNQDDCQNHGWSLPGEVFDCDGTLIIGNYQYDWIVEKQFLIPDPYKLLRFSATIYKIDSWDGEGFDILCNNQLLQKIILFDQDGTANLCRNSTFNDKIIYFERNFSFIGPDFTIKFQNHLDQDISDESWGFKNTTLEILIPCVNFYSECDYQGEMFQMCYGDNTKFQFQVPFEIRSINMNNQTKVRLRGPQYADGTTQQYTDSQPCLNSYKVQQQPYQVSQNSPS